MKCSIIQDLLPLYVDGVVSEDTAQAVEEHLADCGDCRRIYEQMSRELELPVAPDMAQESAEALKAVKQAMRWKAAAVAAVFVLLTLVLVISGYMVFENVGVVHDFFDPSQLVVVRERQTGGWQPLRSLEDTEDSEGVLCFDNIFYSRKVVNDARSDGLVSLRFRDMDGDVVLEVLDIQPGTSASLKELRPFVDYHVEIKAEQDRITLNFH